MTFSSLAFLFVFFPLVFLLYFICRNNLGRNIILIISSLIFYAYGEPVAVFIMLISVGLNYLFGLLCARTLDDKDEASSKSARILSKTGLILAIILNIGLLFFYKYADFFLNNIGYKGGWHSPTLPIGISFFTFQGLSYCIDVYRDKKYVQKNFLSVLLYISFFPQLIAGPIVKYHDIRDQLITREFNAERVSSGIERFIYGLGKKVLIAGPMGLVADYIYGLNPSDFGSLSAWIAAISYMFQIYFDFSGYSDMAIGLGCIFGFDFKENFNYPYISGSMKEFWRRWHISLSTWFREYVYIPLGGNRKGRIRSYFNKFVVFMLTGLWHGANWTFICWGIMHGLAVIIEDIIKSLFKRKSQARLAITELFLSGISHLYALFFIMLSFIVFRSDSISYAIAMIKRLFAKEGLSSAMPLAQLTPVYIIAFIFAILLSTPLISELMNKCAVWARRGLSLLIYLASILMLISGGYNPFIYFRF